MPERPTFEIAGRSIGPGHPCYVIAEIGINHGGDEGRCTDLIAAAAEAGADAAKLQTVTPDHSYHPDTESYALFKDSVLSEDALRRLMERARAAGIALFSTPGDLAALALIVRVGMPALKISSGLLTNLPLIAAAAATGRPLILSTGMAHLAEVLAARDAAVGAGAEALAFLQCTSLYPAPSTQLNLRAIATLRAATGCSVGFSDHHDGDMACLAAVAAGAALIEKHVTLNATAPGGDHAISLEPAAFAAMVTRVREVETMLGSDAKAPTPEEEPLRGARHRRLVAARALQAGERIAADDLHLMRLPSETAAMRAAELDAVVGHRTSRPVARLEGITADLLAADD